MEQMNLVSKYFGAINHETKQLKLIARHYDRTSDDFQETGISGLEVLKRIKAGADIPTLDELIEEYRNGNLRKFQTDGRFLTRTLVFSKTGPDEKMHITTNGQSISGKLTFKTDLNPNNFEFEIKNGRLELELKNEILNIFEKIPSGWYEYSEETLKEKSNQLNPAAFFVHTNPEINAALASGFENIYGGIRNLDFSDEMTRKLGLLEYQ